MTLCQGQVTAPVSLTCLSTVGDGSPDVTLVCVARPASKQLQFIVCHADEGSRRSRPCERNDHCIALHRCRLMIALTEHERRNKAWLELLLMLAGREAMKVCAVQIMSWMPSKVITWNSGHTQWSVYSLCIQ